MNEMTPFERAAMDMLLAGDHPILELLRKQYRAATVEFREETGVGVFVHFSVPKDIDPITGRRSFEIIDVRADVEGLQHGVGFVLFVRDGYLSCLEAFLYADDKWPEKIERYRLSYIKLVGVSEFPCPERDWEALTKVLEGLSD